MQNSQVKQIYLTIRSIIFFFQNISNKNFRDKLPYHKPNIQPVNFEIRFQSNVAHKKWNTLLKFHKKRTIFVLPDDLPKTRRHLLLFLPPPNSIISPFV